MKPVIKNTFGAWSTPLSSSLVVGTTLQLDEARLFASEPWWLERCPEQGGRVDIVHYAQGIANKRLPAGYSCRSRVHEYGGGSYCICTDGVYFVNDQDQQIYYLGHNDQLRRISSYEDTRYADLIFDARRNQLICIAERHYDNAPPENSLLAINIVNAECQTLASGHDFYASPKLSPDGNQLAWLCWNHPYMPWDANELWLAQIGSDAALNLPQRIAGSESVSVFQPEWSASNELYFIDDRTGWWNLYRVVAGNAPGNTQALYQSALEFGLPQWVFGQRCYGFIDAQTILCSYFDAGKHKLGILDVERNSLRTLDTGFNNFSHLCVDTTQACFIAASDESTAQIIQLDLASAVTRSLRASAVIDQVTPYISQPQVIEFNTRHGDSAHAIYYPAYNPDIAPSADHKPPLIVITHGGPTSRNAAALDLRKQYWTSRGYALLDVNYSGSTGYGRAYRERLLGQWGLRDAEDCCDAALHMIAQGLVDPARLIIKGSSAGGYTVLCALAFHNVFAAGASYYGICELEALAQHTHKFEAHYLDRLIGPYPEMRATYQQRSPLNALEGFTCPVIFFQGRDDKVVPSAQAEMMFNALKKKGLATSYLSFAGEAHGFRKTETQLACLKAELEFYARVLDLPLDAECDGTLLIENFSA